ncbi:vitamin B12-dependent ribonucleotide reductase [Longimicrobium terrae]|uniref:Vitamin B12-dependent ribonucleotide reductase n=1 Tax=Longimicrobium terrae TaxID=1639882 RepID=A0A841H555_9BACT|nr:vitamin B12-dependent ribonucleotide reductase [Longimicrobium terrae]MBB4638931.1 ribonucleoside-diphosphate reductase alpha chain [Longimicrobium terrae]MBB6073170.1 ribonucleoside-diphosphate reductase alpha chain [Longimicrobium terrae]
MTPSSAPTSPIADLDLPRAELSDNARIVLAKRYLRKDEKGKPVEEPEEMFWRVAYTIAQADAKYGAGEEQIRALAREFYLLMTRRLFEPNSPTLMNAGRPLGQLSACFVLPVDDALSNGQSGVYDTLRSMAMVHQSGGGTGFSFSRIRPEGDLVNSTTGVASGPISFMSLYDSSTEVVKQGGTRRGANMGILRVDHPNVEEFIDCKQDITKITNFNISVAITDAFMRAVQKGEQYDLINPRTQQVVGQKDARAIFDKIVQNAWRTGEPGVFFIDRANFYNPVPHLGSYEATNPCGEQPLLPYDVCNLGSVNIGAFVRDDVPAGEAWSDRIDWKEYRRVTRLATHFLDNVIDANQYPLPEITDLANRIRRIGLGVMGFADLLVRLGVPYNSAEGVEIGRRVMEFLDEESKRESERLAQTRGVFPEWEQSIWGPDETAARAPNGERIRPVRAMRNCNVTTVAPTGTISIFAGCSSGIEPLFAVAFMRNQAGSLMPDVNEDFTAIAHAEGWYSAELMERIAREGHIHFAEVPEHVQRAFSTAHDITPEWHVRMQAAFQEHCDSAISKTTNFPNGATVDDVRKIYELAFDLNCKGVTVYRDGSRDGQVLSTGATKTPAQQAEDASKVAEAQAKVSESAERIAKLEREVARLRTDLSQAEHVNAQARRQKRKRPNVLRGTTRKMNSPLGDVFVTINEDREGHEFEVFATLGKAGSVAMADVEAIGRLISMALRFGIPVGDIYQQLRGISSDRAVGFGENKVLSVPDAIAQALGWHQREKAGIQQELIPEAVGGKTEDVKLPEVLEQPQLSLMNYAAEAEVFMGTCPDCSSQLEFAEGCKKCHACGFSECG